MKIDVAKLPYTKSYSISEEISFDHEKFICHFPLIEVKKCFTTLKFQRFEEFIYVDITLKADVILQCSYTLKNFECTIKGNDELHFSPTQDDDEDCILYKGNQIEMDEYIFNLLSASVPLTPKAPGVNETKLNFLTDEEYFKQKNEEGNSQFDALKDLEFDE